MTLMSPKECEMVRCNQNQFQMTPDSPVLDLLQSPVAHPTRQVACLTLGNYRDSLIYRLKSRGTLISAQELEESSTDAISSQEEIGFLGFY